MWTKGYVDGRTNNSFRMWGFCLITSTHSYSYSPLRIPRVMTYPSIMSPLSICLLPHPCSFIPSIYPSSLCSLLDGCLFWSSLSVVWPFFYSPYLLCSTCAELFIPHYIDVSTLYTSAYSNSGLPVLRTLKGLSMLPFHLCLFSLP
jgi:hypothetical protein